MTGKGQCYGLSCVWCHKPIIGFHDKKSKQEFRISGLCQECQDRTFNKKGKTPNWFTEDLKQKVRDRYEPKYQRSLTDEEVMRIGTSLADLVEITLKVKSRHLIKS